MKHRRHTPEQVICKLREADRILGERADIPAVCRHLEVSEQTNHRWRQQYDSMQTDDVKRRPVGVVVDAKVLGQYSGLEELVDS